MSLNEFDHKNVSPEKLKEWDREYRNQCRREMTQYLKSFPDATPEERRALSSWVRSGHSPYENGYYVVTESGAPMDFINAERHMEDEHLKYLENPEGYWKFHNTSEAVSSNGCPDNDLPF